MSNESFPGMSHDDAAASHLFPAKKDLHRLGREGARATGAISRNGCQAHGWFPSVPFPLEQKMKIKDLLKTSCYSFFANIGNFFLTLWKQQKIIEKSFFHSSCCCVKIILKLWCDILRWFLFALEKKKKTFLMPKIRFRWWGIKKNCRWRIFCCFWTFL